MRIETERETITDIFMIKFALKKKMGEKKSAERRRGVGTAGPEGFAALFPAITLPHQPLGYYYIFPGSSSQLGSLLPRVGSQAHRIYFIKPFSQVSRKTFQTSRGYVCRHLPKPISQYLRLYYVHRWMAQSNKLKSIPLRVYLSLGERSSNFAACTAEKLTFRIMSVRFNYQRIVRRFS